MQQVLERAKDALARLGQLDDQYDVKRYHVPADAEDTTPIVEDLERWLRLWIRANMDEDGVFRGRVVDGLRELAPDEEASNLYRLRGQLTARLREAGFLEPAQTRGAYYVRNGPVTNRSSIATEVAALEEQVETLERENQAMANEVDRLHRALRAIREAYNLAIGEEDDG